MEMNGDSVMSTSLHTKTKARIYDALSLVMHYPETATGLVCEELVQEVERCYPDQLEKMQRFVHDFLGLSQEEREEIYVSTFDVMPVCCMDVGFSVFGEDYKRGQFMAELVGRYREHGIDTGTNLPDFLPNILKLVPHLDYAEAQMLVNEVVLKAMEKMVTGFGAENPYHALICVVQGILQKDYRE